MPWVCPKCGRSFRGVNQWHGCGKYTVMEHLDGKPGHIVQMYTTLESHVRALGDVRVEATKTSIKFKVVTTFASIYVQTRSIRLEFILDHPEDIFPIQEVLQYSKNRFAHTLSIDSPEDIDEQLLGWLTEAHETVKV